jgi:hypothetical protein
VGGAFAGDYIKSAGGAHLTLSSSTQRVAGVADLSGDGRTDLIIQDDATGELLVWSLDGVTRLGQTRLTPSTVDSAWRIRSVADLNGDQHADLVWQHTSTGDMYVWYLVGTTFVRGEFVTPPRVNTIWQIVGSK